MSLLVHLGRVIGCGLLGFLIGHFSAKYAFMAISRHSERVPKWVYVPSITDRHIIALVGLNAYVHTMLQEVGFDTLKTDSRIGSVQHRYGYNDYVVVTQRNPMHGIIPMEAVAEFGGSIALLHHGYVPIRQ